MTTPQSEFVNWTKSVTGLGVTKIALCNHITTTWKNELYSWDQEEISHLPDFLKDIDHASITLQYKEDSTGRKRWKIKCTCRLCQSIFDRLRLLQSNESKRIVWNPVVQTDKQSTKENKTPLLQMGKNVLKQKYVEKFSGICNTCKMEDCPFERNRQGIPLFDETRSGPIDDYYWQIANMYMFCGNERHDIPNSDPENTDAASIFKMMRNCKLFKLKDESSDEVYTDLLEVRNFLMHSADQRINDEALDICFRRMETLLQMEQLNDVYCQKAIVELSKLKRLEIITLCFSPEDKIMITQALCLQTLALEFEINVEGTLKDDVQLKSILKALETKKTTIEKDTSDDISIKDLSDGISRQALGTTGAGALAGAALGAGFGWVVGKIMYHSKVDKK